MKYKKLIVVAVSFLFILAICSFLFGIYFRKNSKPQIIFEKSFDSIVKIAHSYVLPSDDFFVGDDFTVDSEIDFDLDSERYSKQQTLEDIQKYHLIQNLNRMDTHLLLIQSEKDQSLLGQFVQQLGSEELIQAKLLVSNATEYYFVNQFLGYYINNGTCNYFETLNGDNTTKENIEYLYHFILKSIRDNIKKEEFSTSDEIESVFGKSQKLHQVSVQFSDESIHNILNGVLSDLKRDKKSYFILKNVFRNFSKYKIKKSVHFLEKGEVYTFHISTSRYLYRPLKYEIIHEKGENKNKISCEIDNMSFDIFYYENDKYVYHMPLSFSDNKIFMKILDSKNKKLGEFHFEKEENNAMLNLSFDDSHLKYDFIYSSKISKLKKNSSYHHDQKLSFKIIKDKVGLLNGSVTATSKVDNKAKIIEDVSSTKLSSKLSDDERIWLKSRKDAIKNRLQR